MKELTKRQQEILSFIKSFIRDHKYPPTMREIAAFFHMSAKGAYDHVKALEKKHQIKNDSSRPRTMEVIEPEGKTDTILEIPLLGNVAAGVPLFAEENFDGSIKIPAENLKAGRHFALLVKGDSMLYAGILNGDTAVFLHRQTADNGDIVVARVNDEAVTLKRFFREKNRIKLKAENPVYPPIYTQNVKILGKLEFIIRQYG
ncbi:MAG: transcriptional repressor LexA [Spirochaetales bacterium]|jgi:repressor LexA|nr:transcriptional repressor LexA [Spirochaetales bacterium]